MPINDALRRWRAVDPDVATVMLAAMRESGHADIADADEYPDEATVLKDDARARLAGADVLQAMYEETD